MKKRIALMGIVALMIWLYCCAPSARVTSTGGPSIDEAQAERYDGPKARLAVGEFLDKTAQGGGSAYWLGNFGVSWKQVGDGMRDMLTTALFNTNRYIVLERERLNEVLAEQDLAAAGRVKKGTEAPTGEIYGADLIITAAVTEFSGSAKGIEGQTRVLGIDVGGGAGKAHIALDIRIIDAKTSQIVAAASVEGDATSLGLGGSTVLGGQLPVSLGGFSKTPIEKAIRVCIQEAVNYVVSQTPRDYYRH
ncbi:MAG: CsgG/HfaB family protein [Candidatus Aminicenantes bacterium]|nr:CsgG/HfaB family protein [Candidatus Aminicenantes bacterium]